MKLLLSPTVWAIAAWVTFVGVCYGIYTTIAEDWVLLAYLCMGLCEIMALITGVAQARRNPEATPVWAYLLGVLLVAFHVLVMLPVPAFYSMATAGIP